MCGGGGIISAIGKIASAAGFPVIGTALSVGGGLVGGKSEKKKAKAAASAASEELNRQNTIAKAEAEKKRKARTPVDVISQTGGQGLGGTLGS